MKNVALAYVRVFAKRYNVYLLSPECYLVMVGESKMDAFDFLF